MANSGSSGFAIPRTDEVEFVIPMPLSLTETRITNPVYLGFAITNVEQLLLILFEFLSSST
jgi:hypothetical protein